ncbi:MAG TPA: alpha/beta hydrolase [Gammaproteobacteria bacterium]
MSNPETHILFVHGAGEGAYKEDKKLAESLGDSLGRGYEVHYLKMPDEENAPYEQWKERIENELTALNGAVVLVGHSVGASILAKCLSEIESKKSVVGVFLLSGPFWSGKGWRYEGYEELELKKDIAAHYPKNAEIFLYHCRDDEIVPFDHLALYATLLPQAAIHELDEGGHQFDNDLSAVAEDIRNLRKVYSVDDSNIQTGK